VANWNSLVTRKLFKGWGIKMAILTKDGYEAKEGSYYYLEDGTTVNLNECAFTNAGEPVFLVAPFYEGEAMSCNGDGGTHNEVSIPYEHEGEATLVKAIFKKAPTKKLGEKYAAKAKQVEELALTIGFLIAKMKEYTRVKGKLQGETEALKKTNDEHILKVNEQSELLKKIRVSIVDRSILNKKLEDMVAKKTPVEIGGSSRSITEAEYKRLQKISFMMDCLEASGIDNWQWYDESMKAYHKEYPEEE
jgi:hypothetical protein